MDHYVMVEMDPLVKEWAPQVEVSVILDGKERRRILDSKVVYWSGRVVVNEVKPEEYVNHPRTLAQMQVQDAWAQAHGAESKLITDTLIRENEILLENCHKMVPWLRGLHPVDEALVRLVLGEVAGRSKPVSIQDLAAALRVDPGILCPVILERYMERQLTLDVATRRFGLGTLVTSFVTV
jgi:hypothetical protein